MPELFEKSMQEMDTFLKRRKEEIKLLLIRKESLEKEIIKLGDDMSALFSKKKGVETEIYSLEKRKDSIDSEIKTEFKNKEEALNHESSILDEKSKSLDSRESSLKAFESNLKSKEAQLLSKRDAIVTAVLDIVDKFGDIVNARIKDL